MGHTPHSTLHTRRRLIRRGHSFCARKLARAALANLLQSARYKAKPRYVAALRAFRQCTEVFTALRERSERVARNVRKLQIFNRNVVRHGLKDWHWVAVRGRNASYKLRKASLFRLKKRARQLLQDWKRRAYVGGRFRRALQRVVWKEAAQRIHLTRLVDNIIASRTAKLMQRKRDYKARLVRAGVWLRGMRRRYTAEQAVQNGLLSLSNAAYFAVGLLKKRRALMWCVTHADTDTDTDTDTNIAPIASVVLTLTPID